MCKSYPHTEVNRIFTAAVAALDEIRPGWEDKVELDVLDMCNVKECVLGQVFHEEAQEALLHSGYDYARETYPVLANETAPAFSGAYVFTDLWIKEIGNRQAAKVALKSDHALTA
jgi:hypothetical protein